MSTQQIDAGLARYYQQKGIQYMDQANGIGKFVEWCNINGYNTDSIKEELKHEPFECTLIEFDQEFPTKKTKINRAKEIFEIIKQCFHDPNAYETTDENTETKDQSTTDGLVRYNANIDENEEVRLCSRLCTLLEMDQEDNIDELEKLLQICNKARTKFSDSKNRFYKITYNKVMNKFTDIPMCMDILYDIGFNKSHDNKKLLCKASKSTIKLLNKTRNILNCMVHDIFSEEGHRFDAELLLHGYARENTATIYRDVCDMILTMLNIDLEQEMSFVFDTENLNKYNKSDNSDNIVNYIESNYQTFKLSDGVFTCRMSDDLIFDNIKYLTVNVDRKLLNSESDGQFSKKLLKQKMFAWFGVQMTVTQIKKILRKTALKSFVMKPCRPLISKFYQRMMNMKFTFDSSHQKIRVGDNGESAMKQKFDSCTIRFGPFLHFENDNEDNLKSYKITLDTRSIGNNSSIGIGFATAVFNDWNTNNFGNNNCCLVKGNGQFYTTEHLFNGKRGLNTLYKNGAYIDGCEISGFFKEGNDVIVDVDLKNLEGVISANRRNVKIDLPKNDVICIIVYMSGSAKKKILVKDQKFIFNDE